MHSDSVPRAGVGIERYNAPFSQERKAISVYSKALDQIYFHMLIQRVRDPLNTIPGIPWKARSNERTQEWQCRVGNVAIQPTSIGPAPLHIYRLQRRCTKNRMRINKKSSPCRNKPFQDPFLSWKIEHSTLAYSLSNQDIRPQHKLLQSFIRTSTLAK